MNIRSKKSLISEFCEGVRMGSALRSVPVVLSAVVAVAPICSNANERELEEIVVTGIRASLQRAADVKRDADSVVDAIVAEDIGKFPDQNLAESLQRISGVSISRVRGEGSRVSVRGLGTGFNLTTLNGNGAVSASSDVNGNGGRDFAFDVLPSELVSGIEVYKSPQADLNEGSLGATVNIKTARPLDNPGFKIGGSLVSTYSELPDEFDPKGSFFISGSNTDDTFGALLSVSHSERSIRQDSVIINGHQFANPDLTTALGGDPNNPPLVASQVNIGIADNTRERTGVGGALQWRPTDNLELVYSGFVSELEETGIASSIQFNPTAGTGAATGAITNGTVTSLVDNVGGPRQNVVTNGNDNFSFPGTNDFQSHSLEASWDIDGGWNIGARAYFTESESEYVFERYQARFEQVGGLVSYDQSGIGQVPSVAFSGVDLSNPATFAISQIIEVPVLGDEDETGFQIDVDKELGGGFFSSFEFGLQTKTREREQNRELAILNFGDSADFVPLPASISGLSLPNDLLSGSSPQISGATFGTINDVFDLVMPGGLGERIQLTGNFYQVEEEVDAAYVKLNFESEWGETPVSGNLGLRYVDTSQTSRGIGAQITGVDTVSGEVTFEGGANIVETNDYDNLLWSLNVKADFNEKLVGRFSAASVIARPPISALAPAITNINPVNGTLTSGNPELEPFEANQFDITLEWYFNDFGYLSGGIFYKDVETLVVSEGGPEEVIPGVVLIATQPRNVDGVTIEGFELSYQQQFANGFGLVANYTYQDNDANFENPFVPGGIGLVGASQDNVNLVGFYETERFSARLAYNYRSDFLERTIGLSGNPEYVDDYGQWDAQVSYDINDSLTVFVDAVDITGEELFRFSNNNPLQLRAITETGARYSIGIRGNF